jgi:hypothetical protein
MDHLHKCPACDRSFDSILDYPLVRLLAFERLSVPEAVDEMSAAAEKPLSRVRERLTQPVEYRHGVINMTPAIERACETNIVQEYFTELESLVGRELSPQALLPKLPPDRVFRRAYPIESTGIFLSLDDRSRCPLHRKPAVPAAKKCGTVGTQQMRSVTAPS